MKNKLVSILCLPLIPLSYIGLGIVLIVYLVHLLGLALSSVPVILAKGAKNYDIQSGRVHSTF